jgi:hypothetical protein
MRIPRPTYGGVTATLALFIALAGTSYAALTITGANVKNGTLSGADLKDGSVAGRDIATGSLTGSDLKNGTLTSSDIKDGALLASDFKTGELPSGPAGPAGPQGPGGLSDVVVRRVDATVPALTAQETSASCADGEFAVSGGAGHSGTVFENIAVLSGMPLGADGSPAADGAKAARWLAGVRNNVGDPRVVSVYVLCARP